MRQGEREGSAGRGERLFNLCLRVYPPAFRREFEPAMAETFAARLGDVLGGFGRWIFLLRECAAVVLGGLGLRVAQGLRLGGGAGKGRAGEPAAPPPLRPLSRLERGKELLPNLARDLRHAARALARRPGVTVNAILALGLGIGLATVIFSFVYAAVYRPLPVPGGNRIMHVSWTDAVHGRRGLQVGYHDYLDWRDQQTAFQDLAAFYTGTVNLSGGERPERFFGGFITPNAWSVLEVQPILGRGFLPGEDRPGAPAVAIIAFRVWQERYGGDPDIVGQVIRLNGEPATILGVMPEGFAFPRWEEVWVPLRVDPLATERGQGPELDVFGRLRAHVVLEEARAEFDGISGRLAREYPATNRDLRAFVEPYIESYQGDDSRTAGTFFLGFGVAVLLIACFNVANLLLAQAVAQSRDVAVRVAMGASRGRVVMGVLQQAFLLAGGGALLGTILTVAGLHGIRRWITAAATYPLPFWMKLEVDGPILLFVLGAVGLSAVASGLIPALRASRADVHGALSDTSWGNSSLRVGRMSRLLVFSQITVTAALLVLAGHMALQVAGTRSTVRSYPTRDVLTARVGLFEGALPGSAECRAFYRELESRLREAPGVVGVALGTSLPGMGTGSDHVHLEGEAYTDEAEVPRARVAYVSPGFFPTFEVPVLEGRGFNAGDDVDAPAVAVVNQPFVERYLSGEEPLGRRIRVGGGESGDSWRTIVGVVGEMDMDGAADPAGDPQGLYLPVAQTDARFMTIALRTRGDPLALGPLVRDEVMALQGDTPVYFVQTLEGAINTGLLDLLLVGSLLGSLALAAFFLAVVGLYGVTTFLAGQRTREVGVRMALGAQGGDVVRLLVRQATVQVFVGLILGVLLAAGAMAVLSGAGASMIAWNSPVAVAAALVLGVTAFAAILAPAWRATKVNPVEAFRG